jgi:hypothetical protein
MSKPNKKNPSGLKQRDNSIGLAFFCLLSLTIISLVLSSYCLIKMQRFGSILQNQLTNNDGTSTPSTTNTVEKVPNFTIREGILVSISSAMLEDYPGKCANKNNADKLALLTLDINITNNSQKDFEFISGLNDKWELMSGDDMIDSDANLVLQGGYCNIVSWQDVFRRHFISVMLGGLSLTPTTLNGGTFLLSGGSMTTKLYFGVNRDINIDNLSLRYSEGNNTVSIPFRISLETSLYYKSAHKE